MKKTISLLLALVMALSLLTACGGSGAKEYPGDAMTLQEIMDTILTDVPELPMVQSVELNAENFEAFAFVPMEDGVTGLVSEGAINAVPHSVVLLRAENADKAAALAQQVKDNADPRKWICVEAEKTVVRQYGSTVLLVMSFTDTANAILTNFDALEGAETPAEDLYTPGAKTDDQTDAPDDAGTGTEQTDAKDEPSSAGEKPAAKPDGGAADKPAASKKTDLSAALAKVNRDVADLPAVGDVELTAENFAAYAFIDKGEGYRGMASEGLIGSIAHSVVLVEVPDGVDAAKVAKQMKDNADPRKWICVEAESVQTAVNGRLVLLVMSAQTTADALVANFNAI